MDDDIDLENLAQLARIEIDDSQAGNLKQSVADILDYVSTVEEVAEDSSDEPSAGPVHNVLREDTDPHEPGKYTESLMKEAPAADADGYIIVPPIL